MAIRVQRAFRTKQARNRLFILRTKLRYQIEARVCHGTDVVSLSGEQLLHILHDKRDLWVFALAAFPWQPVSATVRKAFNRVATNWSYLRRQRMCFAVVNATDTVNLRSDDDLDRVGASEWGSGGTYSLVSALSLDTTRLPTIVAFWFGTGHGIVNTPVVGRSKTGNPILKRRYERVCGESHRCEMLFTFNSPTVNSVKAMMSWMETLVDSSRDAAATDLQAYARGFLSRRHYKRMRVLHAQRASQRVRRWIDNLRTKQHLRKTTRAAVRIQRWTRGIFGRRGFWQRLHEAIQAHRIAATAVQRAYRRFIYRKRLRNMMARRTATPARYPNAPLCEECLGVPSSDGTYSLEEQRFTLAHVNCRDCRQPLCESCAAKLHGAGKRMQHVFHSIDLPAMSASDTPMCELCQVASVARACQTCRRDSTSSSELLMCRSCFYLQHCRSAVPRNGAKSANGRSHWWWQAEAFRRHQWRIVRSQDDISTPVLSSRAVIKQNGWMTFAKTERDRQAALTAENSRQARANELFTIRAQHEAILRDAFERYDADQSGSIDREEFRRMFREELCQPLSDDQVDRAMQAMDRSGNGMIEFDELLEWFAEDVLDNKAEGEGQAPASLALLKETLKAKRMMRRYKEKLTALMPSPSALTDQLLDQLAPTERQVEPPAMRSKVPGFPAIEALDAADFAAKRGVFFRFLHEICGLDWVFEDEPVIPIAEAMDVFARVFVPRWNAGQLTHDYYFDDEQFVFDGLLWRRRWDAERKQYGYHAKKRKHPQPLPEVLDQQQPTQTTMTRRPSRRSSRRRSSVSAPVPDEFEDVVEWIDPRRKQMLWAEAKSAFASADTDGSGLIDQREFRRLLVSELCEPLSKAQAKQVFAQIDADHSGSIDVNEFFAWYATHKCQDLPLNAQTERARAVLKTKRRVRRVSIAAIEATLATGAAVKDAVERKLQDQQLARDSHGASPELLTLLHEGYPKLLALKALGLHGQDVGPARAWLAEKRDEEQREAQLKAEVERQARMQRRQSVKEASVRRQTKLARYRKSIVKLVVGTSAAEAHATRLQDAVTNLEHEIRKVERQATLKLDKGHQF